AAMRRASCHPPRRAGALSIPQRRSTVRLARGRDTYGNSMGRDERLERGLTAFAQWRWREAYEALSAIDTDGGLAAEQLDQLAIAAYLLGRDADAAAAWTRAHHCFIDAAEKRRAARCGFWLSLTALLRGDGAV